MIIEAEATTVVSNISVGKEIQMGITATGMARLMANLTNMYNDPKLAVIREYFANALDSHVRAGQTVPVEVSLPTSYNKMYIVQDFGTGMSLDDIENIYSQYGESTKGNTNDEIGAFGLGAKSALAIANQFTLVTIKDGVKATVLIRKSGNGSGIPTMSIVSAIETDEANGVTVSIPVDDVYSFVNKAREFFRFVDPDLVLVDGYAPKSVFSSATRIETELDDVEIYAEMDYTYGQSYVVMGQVAYALTTANIEESAERLGIQASYELRNMPVYFRIPIGSVNLTPNREGLLYDDKTNAMFDSLVSAYMETIQKTAQEEVDAIDDRFEVQDVVTRWENRLGVTLQWRGEDVPKEIRTATSSSTIKRTWNTSSHGNTHVVRLGNGYRKIIVTGQPFDKYKRASNYITDYLSMIGINENVTFYFRETLDELDTPWITEHPEITFEDFNDMIQRVKDHRKAERAAARAALPKEKRDRAAKLEYPVLDIDEDKISLVPYDEIPADSYYIAAEELKDHGRFRSAFEGKPYGHTGFSKSLELLVGEGSSVVFISKGRSLDSFLTRTRNIEGLKNLRSTAPEIQQRVNDLLTEDVLRPRGRRLNYSTNRRIAGFDEVWRNQILDEELRELVADTKPELEEARTEAINLLRAMNVFDFMGVEIKAPEWVPISNEKDYGKVYPLIDAMYNSYFDQTQQEHLVMYMNMIYEAQLTLVDA
jgi:hypothetical protein